MPSAPNNYKIHLVDPDPATTVKPNSDSTSNPIPNINPSSSKICQHTWSQIFNNKQEPRDINRCDDKENNWLKAKENWDAAISAAKYYFMLKYEYVPPDKSDPYTCNTSNLAGGYIFKIP